MSNLFKGYAQKTDFSGNLLKGVVPAARLLEEGHRYLSQWKDVSQGEQENQERYLRGLEAKFQAEEADRARNRKLEEYFADGWRDALTTRHSQIIKNKQAKVAESQRTAQKLAGWSEKATELGVQAGQKIVKAQQDYGQDLALQLGLSWKTVKGIQAADGVFNETYAGTEAAIWEARKKGASWEQINQLHNLNFLGNQGYRVGVAMNAGENYRFNGIINKGSIERDVRFPQKTLNSAIADGNLEAVQAHLNLGAREYMQEVIANTGISDKLYIKYARDAVNRANGRVITTVKEQAAKTAQQGVQLKAEKSTETKLKDGVDVYKEFLSKRLDAKGANRAAIWSSEYNNIVGLISKGLIGQVEIDQLMDMDIDVNGDVKKYIHKFPGRAQGIKDAYSNYLNKLNRNAQIREGEKKRKLKESANALRFDLQNRETPLPPEQLSTMIAEANRLHGNDNDISKMLIAYNKDHVSDANDTIWVPELERLQNLGLVTASYVKSRNLTPAAERKWMKVAKEQDPFQPTNDEAKALEQHVEGRVEELLSKFGVESKNVSSSDWATTHGKNVIKQYFTAAAKNKDLTRQEMLKQAMERFEVDVQKDYQVTEFQNNVRMPHFAKFSVSAKMHSVPLSDITAEELAANPKLPYEKVLVEPAPVVKFWTDVSQGRNTGFPTEARHYVSKFGLGPNGEVKMTELMFLEAQMKLINPDFEIPEDLKQAHKVGFSQIDPRYQKYITGAHANLNSTAVGIKYSGYDHKDLQSSNNYSEKNKALYNNILKSNPVRNPDNFAWFLNLDPEGDADKLDWTEMLVGGYYG